MIAAEIRDWVHAFLARMSEERAVTNSTLASYGSDLHHFAEAMERTGVLEPGALQAVHIHGYMNRLRMEGRTGATLARRLVALRRLCRFGVIERIIERDPTLQVEAPKQEKKQPQALRRDQLQLLLAAPDEVTPYGMRDRTMLALMYGSGLRVSELTALDVEHVRAEMGFLHCIGTGGRERIVPIGPDALRSLKRFLDEGRPALLKPDKPTRALFPNHLGTRMTRQGCWKIIKKHAEAVGIGEGLTPNRLRHSFAVHLLENGADVRAVQEMLGHVSAQATQKYHSASRVKVKDEYDRAFPRA